jgi:hypothetical protein
VGSQLILLTANADQGTRSYGGQVSSMLNWTAYITQELDSLSLFQMNTALLAVSSQPGACVAFSTGSGLGTRTTL